GYAAAPQQPAVPTAPSAQPIGGSAGAPPARTQSAIQRIVLQRTLNRATYIGIGVGVLLVIAIGIGVIAIFTGEDDKSTAPPSRAQIIQDVT
ncbi:hypothetical protein, partial [Streptomyces niveiscabiei]|uniref:hypothetical protein n=1 Tax=Streptomyces niveiscabiei TaxID=164115 RepID=UPI0038F689CB